MATVHEKVLNWLYSVLTSEYADVNRTYSDAAEALSHYPSLSPRTEVYTYENGRSELLLLLSGTLPVTFRGTVYRFPIALWVPHQYPVRPPMVYITPSQDMIVRPGQHVSSDGRVYHPYLTQWEVYWDKSTIRDFLAVLRSVFAKEPPVISKQQLQYGVSRPEQLAPPPVPPPPEEWRKSTQSSPAPTPAQGPPAPPPPPPKPPRPQESQEASHISFGGPSNLQDAGPRPPPVPPHPGKSTQSSYPLQNQWQQHPPGGLHAQAQFQANTESGLSSQVLQQPYSRYDQPAPAPKPLQHELESPVSPISPINSQPQPLPRYQQPAPFPPQATSHPAPGISRYEGPPPPQLSSSQQHPLNQQLPLRPYPVQAQPGQYVQQPKPQQPVPDLLDSPLDVTLPSQLGLPDIPAPPIPPNPEKDALLKALSTALVTQLRKTIADNSAAIIPLQAQQQALYQARAKMQSELDQLQQLDTALASNEKILRDAMIEADRVMEEARTRKVPDVDDVLVAPTVVGGQLYMLCAEEMACADALFILGRALDKGRIGADVFVKQTRSLAREQFMKKALIKKIAVGMGLDEFSYR